MSDADRYELTTRPQWRDDTGDGLVGPCQLLVAGATR